ncbi:transmembrane protein 272-like [Crassostrea virginica]|uniref:Uncharacterized protein LOC111132142 n=1 Tax=Crassostrea virginica TaxID=6565 RepID=A0A8B8E7Z1_CRAVI|nr:uncharacterized protein LOC111132142 [Crassostrea virginica]
MSFTTMENKEAKLESAPAYDGAPPPSYESLYGKIKHAKETSDGNINFAKTAAGLICASVGCTAFLGVVMAIPIASIVIGAQYLDDCPLEKYIPIYLVVSGSVGLFYNIFGIIKSACCKKSSEQMQGEEEGPAAKLGTCMSSLLSCFMSAWFIAGNVWVYSNYDDISTNAASANYCHPTAYYFAFWVITSVYIIIGLVILLSCCCCVALCFCGKKE